MYYTTQVLHVHAHVWLSGVLAVVVSVCKPVRGCFFQVVTVFFNHCSGVCGSSPGSVHWECSLSNMYMYVVAIPYHWGSEEGWGYVIRQIVRVFIPMYTLHSYQRVGR